MLNSKDPSDYRRVILESPEQFRIGFELAKGVHVPGKFNEIVISGMGGSALPGNLLRIYLNDLYRNYGKKPLAIYQNRFYSLPPESYNNCLNIFCSYSGNTEETISSFREAIKNKLPSIALSCGGEMEILSRKNNIPHVKLPMPYPNFQPRSATGYFFSVIFQLILNHGLANDTTKDILRQTDKIKKKMLFYEKEGKVLAKKIVGKTPIFYASTKYKALAMIWKINFNENAKTPAFWNFFPELNHNEMLGFTLPQSKFFVLMLRDPNDNPRNLIRFEATSNLLKKHNVDTNIVDLDGEGVFSKIFSSLALGAFSSYALALEYNQDPTPIEMVEELKVILARKKGA
ncbi:MAG: SIS domain-containing protein [Candidatus Levybacteria bacterium]|nr:SIS domain-containing protein [Candidatus Levybacteria bacterium]